jgi:hypothetical protein
MDRKTIPKSLKTLVWNKYIGEENGIGKCNVCGSELKVSNFDCGHIISVKEGGEDIIHNLAPICRTCNLSMGTENLNEFKERYFSDKSYLDIYVKHFLTKTSDHITRKGFMGYNEYECPHFLSANTIYSDYREWLHYNHIRYYEEMGFTSWVKSPEKKELQQKCIDTFGDLVADPIDSSGYGFINIKFK